MVYLKKPGCSWLFGVGVATGCTRNACEAQDVQRSDAKIEGTTPRFARVHCRSHVSLCSKTFARAAVKMAPRIFHTVLRGCRKNLSVRNKRCRQAIYPKRRFLAGVVHSWNPLFWPRILDHFGRLSQPRVSMTHRKRVITPVFCVKTPCVRGHGDSRKLFFPFFPAFLQARPQVLRRSRHPRVLVWEKSISLGLKPPQCSRTRATGIFGFMKLA